MGSADGKPKTLVCGEMLWTSRMIRGTNRHFRKLAGFWARVYPSKEAAP